MIIKGSARTNPDNLARHLLNRKDNERIAIVGNLNLTVPDNDIAGALREMVAIAKGTNCEKPLYHAIISPEPGETMGPDGWAKSVDVLEKVLGLQDHQRVVLLHKKHGREHVHVVWNRVDIDRMKAVSMSHNYRKHERAARILERVLGHAKTPSKSQRRQPEKTPEREPGDPGLPKTAEKLRTQDIRKVVENAPREGLSHFEHQRQKRLNIDEKAIRKEVAAAWREASTPDEFKKKIEAAGMRLVNGERGPLILDESGGYRTVARCVSGLKVEAARQRLSGLELPSLEDGLSPLREQKDKAREGDSKAPTPQVARGATQEAIRGALGAPKPPPELEKDKDKPTHKGRDWRTFRRQRRKKDRDQEREAERDLNRGRDMER